MDHARFSDLRPGDLLEVDIKCVFPQPGLKPGARRIVQIDDDGLFIESDQGRLDLAGLANAAGFLIGLIVSRTTVAGRDLPALYPGVALAPSPIPLNRLGGAACEAMLATRRVAYGGELLSAAAGFATRAAMAYPAREFAALRRPEDDPDLAAEVRFLRNLSRHLTAVADELAFGRSAPARKGTADA